jgi:hypothetical protein
MDDASFRENFLVCHPIVTLWIINADLLLVWKMINPRCAMLQQGGSHIMQKQPWSTSTVFSHGLEK